MSCEVSEIIPKKIIQMNLLVVAKSLLRNPSAIFPSSLNLSTSTKNNKKNKQFWMRATPNKETKGDHMEM